MPTLTFNWPLNHPSTPTRSPSRPKLPHKSSLSTLISRPTHNPLSAMQKSQLKSLLFRHNTLQSTRLMIKKCNTSTGSRTPITATSKISSISSAFRPSPTPYTVKPFWKLKLKTLPISLSRLSKLLELMSQPLLMSALHILRFNKALSKKEAKWAYWRRLQRARIATETQSPNPAIPRKLKTTLPFKPSTLLSSKLTLNTSLTLWNSSRQLSVARALRLF